MSDSTNPDPSRDGAAERMLRESFKANVLSPEALRRIRRATEQEWRSATRVAPRPRWRSLAAAASVAMLGMGAGGVWLVAGFPSDAGATLGTLASYDAPGVVEVRPLRRDVILAEGSTVRAGHELDVLGNSLVVLRGGGNMRLARASAIEVEGENVINLKRGELYVDIPPGSQMNRAFHVVTGAGEFRHVGTQFAVAIVEGQTRLRVREGQVLWRADAGDSTVPAGTELIIEKDGKATRRSIATAGREWAWMESLTPDVVIEGRPVIEFLEWFARETGRKLVMDDATREQAASIRMHGDVHALTVTEALSAIMATTTLRYELPEGAIRVSSTRESETPRR
jgi:ferric-dicitrate binding protein FerR (iron transport regulator)